MKTSWRPRSWTRVTRRKPGHPYTMTDLPNDDAFDDLPDEIVEAEVFDEPIEHTLELPEDPAEAVSMLITELMATRTAAADATDKWQRAAAEFENFRKRNQRDQDQLISRSSERVVMQLLPVLDSLDAAMSLDAETENESQMLSGMAGTRELLLGTLAREGVEPIDVTEAAFDPGIHEAVQIAEGDGKMVVEAEFRRGYTINGKVLRASLVSVGYVSSDEPLEEGEDDESE